MKRKLLSILLALAMAPALFPALSASAEAAEAEAAEAAEAEAEEAAPEPDPEGTVSFANLDTRVREGNLNALILEENIAVIESLDYDALTDDLRDTLNGISAMQWMYAMTGDSYAYSSLSQSYSALRDSFDDIKDGKTQKDNADLVRQLRNTQDLIVLGAESLYVGIAEAEAQQASLARQAEALDRTLREMELRYSLGQVSALALEQVKSGRIQLDSGRQTLDMTIQSYKLQLEQLVGAPLTGEIALAVLPEVADEDLAAMDLEADLAAAKEASYELYAAKLTLDDAEKDWKDVRWKYNERNYKHQQALHTWQAAEYTYENTVQDYELRFRKLYLQVKDYAQALAASRTALALEQQEYAAEQAKYELGKLSANGIAAAADELESARDAVGSAERNLFSACNNYRWAVDHGILN